MQGIFEGIVVFEEVVGVDVQIDWKMWFYVGVNFIDNQIQYLSVIFDVVVKFISVFIKQW